MDAMTTEVLLHRNAETWRLSIDNPFLEALKGGHVRPEVIEKGAPDCHVILPERTQPPMTRSSFDQLRRRPLPNGSS